MQVTFEKWRYKSNPVYPPVEKVRDEIMQMLKGMICSAIFPSLSLYFANTSLSQTFCGWGGYSLSYHIMTTFVVWLGSDFFEFFYHRLGHVDFRFWKQVRWILQLLHRNKNLTRNLHFSISITMSSSILPHLLSSPMNGLINWCAVLHCSLYPYWCRSIWICFLSLTLHFFTFMVFICILAMNWKASRLTMPTSTLLFKYCCYQK